MYCNRLPIATYRGLTASAGPIRHRRRRKPFAPFTQYVIASYRHDCIAGVAPRRHGSCCTPIGHGRYNTIIYCLGPRLMISAVHRMHLQLCGAPAAYAVVTTIIIILKYRCCVRLLSRSSYGGAPGGLSVTFVF